MTHTVTVCRSILPRGRRLASDGTYNHPYIVLTRLIRNGLNRAAGFTATHTPLRFRRNHAARHLGISRIDPFGTCALQIGFRAGLILRLPKSARCRNSRARCTENGKSQQRYDADRVNWFRHVSSFIGVTNNKITPSRSDKHAASELRV